LATTRPFAYNTGSTIPETTQVGNLAVGQGNLEYSLDYGGVKWWMGADEDLGYVIARPVPNGNQPNPVGVPVYLGFERSEFKTEQSFLDLVSVLFSQTFNNGADATTWLNNNGYWTSYINLTPTPTNTPTITITPSITLSITPTNTPTPSITPSITPTQTPTNTITPSRTPTQTPTNTITPSRTPTQTPTNTPTTTITPTITPSISLTPTTTPTISVTPSITPSSSIAVTFSQTFTNGQSPGTSIENAWTTFRSQLTGTYTQFDFTSSNGQGYTAITDSIKVQQIANSLRTGTTGVSFATTISGVTWNVGCCACRSGGAANGAVEFANVALCSASSTAALRPWIANSNWGGIGSTVNAATQTLTLKFY
jgi:hypothetical protein